MRRIELHGVADVLEFVHSSTPDLTSLIFIYIYILITSLDGIAPLYRQVPPTFRNISIKWCEAVATAMSQVICAIYEWLCITLVIHAQNNTYYNRYYVHHGMCIYQYIHKYISMNVCLCSIYIKYIGILVQTF